MARTSNLANVATVTRASKQFYPDWDWTSGAAVGALTEFASGVAAYGLRGLLVEPAVTNYATAVRMEGSLGAYNLPAGAEIYNVGSFTFTKANQTTDNGWPGMEARYVLASGASYHEFLFAPRSTKSMSAGDYYCNSVCVEIVAGSLANVATVELTLHEFDAGGTAQSTSLLDISGTLDATRRRFYLSRAMTGTGSAVDTMGGIRITSDGGGAVDLTLRISAPQFENNNSPTSPIMPDSGTAATARAASIVNVDTSAWFSESAATLYVDLVPHIADTTLPKYPTASTPFLAAILKTENTDYLGFYQSATVLVPLVVAGSATVAFGSSSTTLVVGTSIKGAIAYAPSDMAASMTGATQATDASGVWAAAPTQLGCGNLSSGGVWSGFITDIRVWPRRLANNELEALVGN